ncbi:MAG: hypothetical protein KBD12_01340 [Candidatus Pacebacteria bacterium]|nr:hypothetical protein [Candidatus Paceibacterota bacterium]
MTNQLIMIRAGDCDSREIKDPSLSKIGIFEIKRISKYLTQFDLGEAIDIYFCNSKRSLESAQIIKNEIGDTGRNIRNFLCEEKIFTNYYMEADEYWLEEEIIKSTSDTMIVVGHIELIRWFPKTIGFKSNYCKNGEGIIILQDEIREIVFDDDKHLNK